MIRIHPTGHPERTIILDGQLGQLDTWQASKESLNGWYGLNSARHTPPDRPWGHGGYPVRGWRGPRSFAIEGWADLSSIGAGQAMMDQLASLKSSDVTGTAVVIVRERDGVERWREVEVHSALVDDSEPLSLEYTVECIAADPRRYGPPITPATQQVSAASSAGFNLLANPGFEAGVSGWFAVIGPGTRHEPLTWVQSGPWGGSAGRYTLTAAADSLSVGTVVALSQPPRFATVAAQSSRDAVLHLTVSWLDAAGRLLVVEKLADQQVAAGQWVTLSGVVRPPAGAATAWLVVDGADSGPWPAGSSLTVDQALLGGSMTSTYRDGDSPGWEWTGTVGASPSRMAGAVWELNNTAGTAPSIPRLSFVPAAPLSAWTVGVSGHGVLAWSGQTIPAGTVVTVDAEAHQVLINGQLPERRWSGVWPEVAAGELAYLVLTTGEVAASATCVWSPAWW